MFVGKPVCMLWERDSVAIVRLVNMADRALGVGSFSTSGEFTVSCAHMWMGRYRGSKKDRSIGFFSDYARMAPHNNITLSVTKKESIALDKSVPVLKLHY